ncbi:MAG: flavodoxin-dependent (E)-4-hydroxy-3-methylbut-2-enyl-diphosphate synthase [Candidatus Aegiribacteria sp.]|nr:flavodoxin-dependent (E)-4-hydroxy-3-methylbut-2-enyl-diphosphate synthase [Candidatus Aegiribacteria sp.]
MGISISRSRTRKVLAGGLPIGGGAPISVQSMTNVPTTDVEAVCSQINMLAARGTEIVRVAVPDRESADALRSIIERSPVPVVSDIHFDPELAILALEAGTDKLRLNPGNIRRRSDIWKICEKASELQVPIRIGVNSGSIPGDLRDKYGGVNRDSMWAAAQRHLVFFEETGFKDIVLSLKSSDPMLTVEVNRLASAECDYPLHLGVTEAGPQLTGSVRSAVALSVLLAEGIGDTIRVSLSGSPEKEPVVGWEILSSLDIRRRFPRVISCPTCARTRIDVAELAESVQESLEGKVGNITIAVMGCEVNGPGEAREANIALIGTPSGIQLFIDGKNTGGIPGSDIQGYLDGIVDSYIRKSEKTAGG